MAADSKGPMRVRARPHTHVNTSTSMHELSWTEEMRITLQRDQEDSEGAGEFRYNIVESKNFCTVAFAQNMDVGEHAALVLRITSVEQQGTIEEGNSCVVVTGFALMNADVNALCLWGFSTEDIWKGSTRIIRGLLISLVRQVDEDEGEEETHLKTFECTNRTAVENVSAVADITALFP